MTIHIEGESYLLLYALGDADRVARVTKIFCEYSKFITARTGQRAFAHDGLRIQARQSPRYGVDSPEASGQPLRDLDQEGIPGSMPEAIVKDFESVDVDKQDCELKLGVTTRNGNRPPQAIEKEHTVGEVCQAVVKRVVRQQVLGVPALRDVPVDYHQSFAVPIASPDRVGCGFEDAP